MSQERIRKDFPIWHFSAFLGKLVQKRKCFVQDDIWYLDYFEYAEYGYYDNFFCFCFSPFWENFSKNSKLSL